MYQQKKTMNIRKKELQK